MMEDNIDDFSLEHQNDSFTLKLEADSDEIKEFFQDILMDEKSHFIDEGAKDQAQLDTLEINDTSVEMVIDDETFAVSAYKLDADVNLDIVGESTHIEDTTEVTYSEINDVEPIDVPSDVKDEANE